MQHKNTIDSVVDDPNKVSTFNTYDETLKIIGEFGLSQRINYIMFCIPYIFTSIQIYGWVFIGARLPHKCVLPSSMSGQNFESGPCNYSTLTSVGSKVVFSRSCDNGYEFNTSGYISDSVVKDFELVCHRKMLWSLAGAAPMVGSVVSGFVFGTFSDRYGRKPTYLIANTIIFASGLLAALAPEFYTFGIARFFSGLAQACSNTVCFIMIMEMVGPTSRSLTGVLSWAFETTGLLLTVAIAYGINSNWRYLELAYTVPSVICILFWWFIPESIRWLYSQGKNETACVLIKKAARINGVTIPDEVITKLSKEQIDLKPSKSYNIFDLFKFKFLRIKTSILTWIWFVCASMYYILLLDQSELSNNPFIGFFITASVQLPGYVFIVLLLDKPYIGRRRAMIAFLTTSGLLLVIHPMLKTSFGSLSIAISIIARFCANCTYTINCLFTSEQYPTVVRGTGFSFCYIAGRLGTILVPFCIQLGPTSHIIYGILAITAGMLCYILPETMNMELIDSIQDGEKMKLTKFSVTRFFKKKQPVTISEQDN